MKSKSSLKTKILFYLILFSGLILFFLWIFQILFLNFYYEFETKKTMSNVRNNVISSYSKENRDYIFDNLSYDKNVCIEIISNGIMFYTSDAMNRGCLVENKKIYKIDFELSDLNTKNYIIKNERLDNKTLVYAVKLDSNTYAYINTSLEPIDSTIVILKKQFIYVSIGVLLLSIIIAIYLSKKISKPIISMNVSARKLAKGEYEPFKSQSDIKEIDELIDTLNYASKELSKTDELRKDLMANVSHDLKTPLTMIRAYAEMGKDLNINNETKLKENLDVIIKESERLNLLVNDILDLSKNEANIKELNLESFNITLLIKNIIKRYDIYKEKENYRFVFKCKENIYINADKQKIEQVIYNLINNAMNYTGKDKTVTIEIAKIKENIRVSIKDTGKGINEEDINDIWKKYYTTNKKHKRNTVGTGLGLSIVRSILENHKFNYGVNSQKGKGTEFYFEFVNESVKSKNNQKNFTINSQ